MECDGVPVLSHGVVNRGEPPLHAELPLSRGGWEVDGMLWSQHSPELAYDRHHIYWLNE